MGKIAVDWSLIKIWCCGKFHSGADISDHTELCHDKNQTASRQTKYSTRRSCIVGSSFLDDMEETEFPKSPDKSPDIGRIESDGFKRKLKASPGGDIQMKIQSPKRRHLSERKSKSNAEVGLASTSRADSISLSPDISDIKNLYDDTVDVEGDQGTSADGNALKKQKDEVEQNMGIISTISEERMAQSPKNKVNEDGEHERIAKAGRRRISKETVDNSKKGIIDETIARVGKTRMVKNKNTVRQKRNPDNKKNEVKIKGETSSTNQQKINIKKEKLDDTKTDKSMTDIASDSDNESVMFLQSISSDFSCKVKNCLANFWFKSELDQHMETVHKK